MIPLTQKESGAYYTPDEVVSSLLKWATRTKADRLLDPSCGDGRFIAGHHNSVGIEQNIGAAREATQRAPRALVHERDFFSWASKTQERFECAAGNPPFIRYQNFKGETRQRALQLCARFGANFSGLSSSWAPFLVATASLLKPGGRMAFVVPAEIGHAPYAAPLLDYLVENFDIVHITAVRKKLFPELSEDCWLLYAQGFGGETDELRFSALETFRPMARPPRQFIPVQVDGWRTAWKRRLRPFLMTAAARELYRVVADESRTCRFGDIASIGIGYVSGANDFFHLRPSEADRWNVPKELLHPTVRKGRVLPERRLTATTVERWRRADDPILLLRLEKEAEIPNTVRRYLNTERGKAAREAYKCRMREPWYSVPDVQVPDFFLTYMSGVTPNLVRNDAGCTCTNSLHSVRLRKRGAIGRLHDVWGSPFLQLSCEIEGHPLGGGMLKLEPREATRILLPDPALMRELGGPTIREAVETMRTWRHYAVN